MKPGGLWLVRDYALNDAAQLRFGEDRKMTDSLFVRQDGTLSYFFSVGTGASCVVLESNSVDELSQLACRHGFEVVSCDHVHSKTTNVKKELDVDRTFVQAKFRRLPS